MATTTYVMFGTDVVSCIYADQWNKSSEVDAPIAGFVDASNGARETLAAYRPSAELFTWSSIAAQLDGMRVPTIVYPKHREEALLKQIQPLPTMLRAKLQAVALPTPPDYVIEWLPFQGGLEDAEKFTEGYDSLYPLSI